MKLLLLVCLAPLAWACSSSPAKTEAAKPADPTRVAITAYMKKTLDDPSSYQPVRWGKALPFQQREVDASRAQEESQQMEHLLDMAGVENQSYVRLLDIPASKKVLDRTHRAALAFLHRADSVKAIVSKLDASTDTTRLGTVVVHTFRAKNKMGALVLDSVRFVVKKSGEVVATAPST